MRVENDLGAYSARWTPARMPTGNAKTAVKTVSHTVPAMTGPMPPVVMPGPGGMVRNDQLIAPMPR
jgi:hypothetical protein